MVLNCQIALTLDEISADASQNLTPEQFSRGSEFICPILSHLEVLIKRYTSGLLTVHDKNFNRQPSVIGEKREREQIIARIQRRARRIHRERSRRHGVSFQPM